jgi:protein tyrosine phosphatase (PTP) superfamily phosphohydrolase (DUF442 family)
MTKPPRSILDKMFHYVPASKTDIRKTLDRERKRLKEAEKPLIVHCVAVPIRKKQP